MGNLRGYEWLILILLVVLLFGARRLPDAARSIGRSLRIFKAETKGLADDKSETTAEAADTAAHDDAPAPALPQADAQPAPPPVTETPKQTPSQPG